MIKNQNFRESMTRSPVVFMIIAAHRFAIAKSCHPSSFSIAASSSFISTLPYMSSKRSGSPPDKSSAKKKVKQQQQSLAGFFSSAKARAGDDDDATDDTTASSFKYKIFCDLDGVLVDFDSGVKSLFNGRSPDQIHEGTMVSSHVPLINLTFIHISWF
jgi:hypothetical protein